MLICTQVKKDRRHSERELAGRRHCQSNGDAVEVVMVNSSHHSDWRALLQRN